MIIIWVRHGTVDCNSKDADTLTPNGREFAKALPDLLENNNIHPDVVFYDSSEKSKSGKPITRCKETVAGLVGSADMIPYKFNDTDPIFEKCKQVEQTLICYTSESLKYFPKIEGSDCAKHMGNKKLPNAPKTFTNKLYTYMIVSEYDGSVITQISTIATGDGK
ncbi:MAG: hypothetical protein GWN62_36555 [Aliifodinibius sp.]|nr:hypothetical protein [Fodinibius sp.]